MNTVVNQENDQKETTLTESVGLISPENGKRVKRCRCLMDRFTCMESNESVYKRPLPSISSVSSHLPHFHSTSIQESTLLPTISSSRHPDLHVITPQTVVHLLQGVYKNQEYKIIDCRFPYEYQGGHLSHAISMVTPMEIKEFLFPPKKDLMLIFYCEFSMYRAPAMYVQYDVLKESNIWYRLRYLRKLDRQIHSDCYPTLYYPHLYLIDGGYKHCFETYQEELCTTPPVYIPMKDKTFKEEYKIQIKGHRQYWKRLISEY